MNWYKISQNVVNYSTYQLRNRNYMDVGHNTGDPNPEVYLWVWNANGQIYIEPLNKLGTIAGITHASLFPNEILNNGICFGRYDKKKNICSLSCSSNEVPDELIWKLMEKFGDNIKIENFGVKSWLSPVEREKRELV